MGTVLGTVWGQLGTVWGLRWVLWSEDCAGYCVGTALRETVLGTEWGLNGDGDGAGYCVGTVLGTVLGIV